MKNTAIKPKPYQWLSLSVFCEIENWKPLQELCLDLINLKSDSAKYLVAIHLARRAQIDIFIKVPYQLKRKFAQQLDQALKKHLNQLSSVTSSDGEYIFMPFPQNSVQYGIVKTPAQQHLKFQQILSRITTTSIASGISQEDVLISLFLIYSVMMHEFNYSYPEFQNVYIEKLMKQAAIDDISAYSDLYDAENVIFNTLSQAIARSEISDDFPLLMSLAKYIRYTLRAFEVGTTSLTDLFKLADELFKVISICIDVDWFMKWSVLYAVKEAQPVIVS